MTLRPHTPACSPNTFHIVFTILQQSLSLWNPDSWDHSVCRKCHLLYLSQAICYSRFLGQPLKIVLSLVLKPDRQETIKWRMNSHLGTYLQEDNASLGTWARRKRGKKSPVRCPPAEVTLQFLRQSLTHFRVAHQHFPSFQKVKKGDLFQ